MHVKKPIVFLLAFLLFSPTSAMASGGMTVENTATAAPAQNDASETSAVKESSLYRVRKNGKPVYMARMISEAPTAVKAMLLAGNSLVGKSYLYGGGHKSFFENRLDCSGAVSSILGQAGLLQAPLDSSSLAQFGVPGQGKWMTIYSNKDHTYIVVAGVRFDSSRQDHPGSNKLLQWRPLRKSNRGFVATHIEGL